MDSPWAPGARIPGASVPPLRAGRCQLFPWGGMGRFCSAWRAVCFSLPCTQTFPLCLEMRQGVWGASAGQSQTISTCPLTGSSRHRAGLGWVGSRLAPQMAALVRWGQVGVGRGAPCPTSSVHPLLCSALPAWVSVPSQSGEASWLLPLPPLDSCPPSPGGCLRLLDGMASPSSSSPLVRKPSLSPVPTLSRKHSRLRRSCPTLAKACCEGDSC